ncbi:hypothetical protein KUC3_27650 [Alteromonas sp. KC3]|uniref:hypothetical protein n=1 Tax=unclassified Alteromonas TaxID=2614992 RepID=UPI00192432E1|nr:MULTISPECIES: hypothetical protein [unclassified Alteromonas]BCO19908.1 hypothetical protein KUC3_27650 [Alteromonas sp. KC3]BCO23873.1 hypothetical protein KUC14_27420 [Alteromonas sp. KC14]
MKSIIKRLAICVTLLIVSGLVNATIISSSVGCNVNNVQLTSMTNVGSNTNLLSQDYSATECAFYYGNDDAHGVSSPNPNIGQLNDGLLNGEAGFDYFHFIDPSDLQILDIDPSTGQPDGVADDPGWIHLANLNSNFVETYSDIGPAPLGDGSVLKGQKSSPSDTAPSLDTLLDITFACTSGTTGDCNAGTWNLDILDLSGLVNTVSQLLGRAALFDQLAISIKSGTPGGAHTSIIYNIDFKDIFAAENNPAILNLQTPYNLGGTFNTNDIGGKGVSHINVWARDPAQAITVSAPSIFMLMTLSLTMLMISRRLRFN